MTSQVNDSHDEEDDAERTAAWTAYDADYWYTNLWSNEGDLDHL
jgi:hypothetical protein